MLTLIKSPFIEFKLTILRNKRTNNSLFRQTMNEISYLIASEVLKHAKFKRIKIFTPIRSTYGNNISTPIIIVPILRAGLGLIEGFVKFLPNEFLIAFESERKRNANTLSLVWLSSTGPISAFRTPAAAMRPRRLHVSSYEWWVGDRPLATQGRGVSPIRATFLKPALFRRF